MSVGCKQEIADDILITNIDLSKSLSVGYARVS